MCALRPAYRGLLLALTFLNVFVLFSVQLLLSHRLVNYVAFLALHWVSWIQIQSELEKLHNAIYQIIVKYVWHASKT